MLSNILKRFWQGLKHLLAIIIVSVVLALAAGVVGFFIVGLIAIITTIFGTYSSIVWWTLAIGVGLVILWGLGEEDYI